MESLKLGLVRDNLVLNLNLRNNSAGVFPVVNCGVLLYVNKKLWMRCGCVAMSYCYSFPFPELSGSAPNALQPH